MNPAPGESIVIRLPEVSQHLMVRSGAEGAAEPDHTRPGPVRIVVTDGVITDWSAPTIDPATVSGRLFADLVDPGDVAAMQALLDGRDAAVRSIRIGAPNGAASHFELSTEIRAGGRVVLAGWDVTAHERRRQALEQLALHDPLTGLANRVLFGERVHDELRRRRRTGAGLAVLYIDLDGFKDVNDTWGHRAGDLLLVALAARLRSGLRPGDTLARLGGDEFGVCCPDITGPDAALVVAHRLVDEATAPVNLGGAIVRVSISVGIAMALDEDVADHGSRLVARADLAMYAAKRSERQHVALSPLAPEPP